MWGRLEAPAKSQPMEAQVRETMVEAEEGAG